MLCATLLPFSRLAELFIFRLALNTSVLRAAPHISEYKDYLGDVFSLAGGVVLRLALVLELLHAHLAGKNGNQHEPSDRAIQTCS